MAVRHLKRYVSWVQTVQHLIEGWGIERFEPRGICYVRGDARCATTLSRRLCIGICRIQSTNIGETRTRCVREGNTEGN